MKKLTANLLLIAVFAFSLASCNQAQKMIDAADQINIQCDPEVLEVVAGNIDATVSVTFPPEYFLPKATLEVTPVLLYVGGEAVGKPFTYQGEKGGKSYLYELDLTRAKMTPEMFGLENAVKERKLVILLRDRNGFWYLMGDQIVPAMMTDGDMPLA